MGRTSPTKVTIPVSQNCLRVMYDLFDTSADLLNRAQDLKHLLFAAETMLRSRPYIATR
jgi:hypothetical protein